MFSISTDNHVSSSSFPYVFGVRVAARKCDPRLILRAGYLGHSSSWSFTQRVLRLTHHKLYHSFFPKEMKHFDNLDHAYELGWDGSRKTVMPDPSILPTLDHAIHLINSVKFHACQTYHILDEESFMRQLCAFYEDPPEKVHTMQLFYIHLLVILAFGKAFTERSTRSRRPVGFDLFLSAWMQLPDVMFLFRHPIEAVELLCSVALYQQAINFRVGAHNTVSTVLHVVGASIN